MFMGFNGILGLGTIESEPSKYRVIECSGLYSFVRLNRDIWWFPEVGVPPNHPA